MNREQFEAWMTDEQWFHGSDFEWDERRNCYAQFGIHLAYKAWQAASKASEQQLSESRREFTAANATIHNLELKVEQLEQREHQLSEENEIQREYIVDHCFIKFDQGGYCPAVSRMPCALTATNQFLSNTQASGAEMAGEYLKQYAQGLHEEARLVLQDAGELCNGFAANLRAGSKYEEL